MLLAIPNICFFAVFWRCFLKLKQLPLFWVYEICSMFFKFFFHQAADVYARLSCGRSGCYLWLLDNWKLVCLFRCLAVWELMTLEEMFQWIIGFFMIWRAWRDFYETFEAFNIVFNRLLGNIMDIVEEKFFMWTHCSECLSEC